MRKAKKKFDSLICFHVDKELKDQLESFAEKRGWKRSLVIREAIRSYLDTIEGGKGR